MILDKIVAKKKKEVARLKNNVSESALRERMGGNPPLRDFGQSLSLAGGPRIIAEVKKSSPSEGPIDLEAQAGAVASQYQAGGAAAISVLVDTSFFGGSYEDLELVKKAVDLPVLCKEFIIDKIQILRAAAAGADSVLLIAAILTPSHLNALLDYTHDLGMQALVEVHDREELEEARTVNPAIIGINNRNLKTMKTNLETTLSLAGEVDPGVILVSESGISSHEDLVRLSEAGVRAFLIGTSLMRATDRTRAVKALITGEPS